MQITQKNKNKYLTCQRKRKFIIFSSKSLYFLRSFYFCFVFLFFFCQRHLQICQHFNNIKQKKIKLFLLVTVYFNDIIVEYNLPIITLNFVSLNSEVSRHSCNFSKLRPVRAKFVFG